MNSTQALQTLQSLGLEPGSSAGSATTAHFTLRSEVIEHTRFTLAVREIARVHERGRNARVAESLLIVAQTGSGKSTLLDYYVNRFPKVVEGGVTTVPVVRVDTPETPTVKGLAESVLEALGDPAADKGSAATKTRRIVYLFKQCRVELLLIDEFQHFFDGRRVAEALRVSNWLKLLITRLRIPVVLVGLPLSIQVVNINPQLRRRFAAPHYMEPFNYTTAEEQLEFRGVLKRIQDDLPVGSDDLAEASMARRFYYASHGLIDYVVKIIDDAVSRGGTGPLGKITMEDYARAFERVVWFNAPRSLNPFADKPTLRLLNRPLEPFDIWDDISNYTQAKRKPGSGRRH